MFLLFACVQDAPLVVGAKPFAEQRVLGEALRMLLLQEGERVQPLLGCQDTWDCQQRLQAGEVDLAVDYTGTGLSLMAAPSGGSALSRVRAAYAPLGVDWLEPIGFENTYLLLVPDWRAVAQDVTTMSALAALGPVTLAVPPEFVRRPTDGLAPMVRRYGLTVDDVLVEEEVGARLAMVIDGRADVAVAYSTDGAIAALPMVPLDDDLGFFPDYAAVTVAHADSVVERPAVARVASLMAGRLDDREMQVLNHQVEVAGYDPAQVARAWLRDEGLVDGLSLELAAPVGLAVDPVDGLDALLGPSRQAVRDALPSQPVRVVLQDPVQALASGEARVALLGAERFFTRSRKGVQRDEGMVAEVVLGTRYVHLLRPVGASGEPRTLGVLGGGAARVAELLWQVDAHTAAGLDELLEKVGSSYDAALVLAPPGDPELADVLARHGLELAAVSAPGGTDLAWLRAARIPAGTYPGQASVVETVSSQVLLASAAVPNDPMLAGGPVAALPSSPRPLERATADALVAALGASEAPDPVLPVARRARKAPAADTALLDTALNIGVLAFLAWLGVLAIRREEPDGEASA